MERAAD